MLIMGKSGDKNSFVAIPILHLSIKESEDTLIVRNFSIPRFFITDK